MCQFNAIRYNPSIVNIVHNNAVYGLTKGQASPTSELGVKTGVQTLGVYNTHSTQLLWQLLKMLHL